MANQNFYIPREQTNRFLSQIASALSSPSTATALFHVYGIGGVGKSRLLEEMQAANQSAANFAKFSFGIRGELETPLELMKALYEKIPAPPTLPILQRDVRQLQPKLDPFLSLYEIYQEALSQLENQPASGKTVTSEQQSSVNLLKLAAMATVSLFATSVDLALATIAEGVGMLKEGFAPDSKERLQQLLKQHPATKNKADLQALLLQPFPALTKAFIEGLQQKAQQRPIVLVLDTYEKAPNIIDFWLCKYLLWECDLRATKIRVVVAGRKSLTKTEYWRKLAQDRDSIWEQPLERFDFEQTAAYLQEIGIDSREEVTDIYQATKGLPYYLDWIRKERLAGKKLSFHQGNRAIVDLLLQGLNSQEKQIIQVAACCRWFDASIMRHLLEKQGLSLTIGNQFSSIFDWLIERDFVECPEKHYRLDDVARDVFRLSLLEEDEDRFYQTHFLLAEYFQQRSDRKVLPDSPPPAKYNNSDWRSCIAEYLYYLLFADRPDFQIQFVSHLFATRYLDRSDVVAIPLQAIIAEADLKDHLLLTDTVKQFLQGVKLAVEQGLFILKDEQIDYEFLKILGYSALQIEATLKLCFSQIPSLDGLAKFAALIYQARRCPENQRLNWLQQAKTQAEQIATAADPEFSSNMFLWRLGNKFYELGCYEEEIASCDTAIKIKPDLHEAWNNRGVALGKLGHYEEAIASYDAAVKIKPDLHEAWYNRGVALFNLGRYEEAIASYDVVVKIKPDLHEAWYSRGVALGNLGRYEEAIASYDVVVKIKPDYHEAWYSRGVALYNLGRYEEAIASYDVVVKIKPDYHEAWYSRGVALGKLGHYEEAIASFDAAVKIKPDDHTAWTNRGVALDNLGRYEEAIASYNTAVNIKPDDHAAWYNRGIALVNLGRYEEAIASYDAAVKIKPDYHEAWDNRGIALVNLGRYEEAIAACDKGIELKPNSPEAWFNKGAALVNLGRYEEAIAAYDKAIDLKPDFSELWNNRGTALLNLGRYEEAIAACDKAIELKPDLPEAWFNRGAALVNLGQYEEAIAACDKGIELKPDFPEPWHNRGAALLNLGQYEEAIASWDAAVKIKPDYHDAWNNRGIALGNLGRYEEAIASYDAAVKIKPDDHTAWDNRGIALGNLGRYEEAIASYDAAVKIKPDDHEAWDYRGIVLFNLGRYEEAIASWDAAVKIKPDYHEAWYNWGGVLGNLGRYEEAIAACDKAIELKPDFPEAWFNKGAALVNLGRYEEAIAACDKAIELKPDLPEAWFNKGAALVNLGQYEEGIAACDKALELKRDFPEPWYVKACCYALQGMVEESITNLQQAINLNSQLLEIAKTDSDFDGIRGDERFQALF